MKSHLAQRIFLTLFNAAVVGVFAWALVTNISGYSGGLDGLIGIRELAEPTKLWLSRGIGAVMLVFSVPLSIKNMRRIWTAEEPWPEMTNPDREPVRQIPASPSERMRPTFASSHATYPPSTVVRDETPEAVRATHLKSERGVREAGVVCLVGAALFGLAGIGCLVFLPVRMPWLSTIVISCFPLAAAAGLYRIGRALRRLESWARPAAIVGAVFLLMVFPLGTVLGALLLAMILRADRFVFSSLYQDVVAATGGEPGKFAAAKS